MFCHNCGKKNREDAKFCEYCGTKLVDFSSEKSENENSTKKKAAVEKEIAGKESESANAEGASIEEAKSSADMEKETNEKIQKETFVSQASTTVNQEMLSTNQSRANQQEVKGKNRKKLWVSILAIITFMAAVGLFFGINYFSKEDKPQATASSASQSERKEKEKEVEEVSKEPVEKTELEMKISQVDNSLFPEVSIYTKIQKDYKEEKLDLSTEDFTISEQGSDGKIYKGKISNILSVEKTENMNINLVIDQSGSMEEKSKMSNAKFAASKFLNEVLKAKTNTVEITSFDDYVYNVQPFTTNGDALYKAINSIKTNGQTALYDAIYDALIQTNQRKGSRFVIAFTDGQENASLHSEDEVVELSRLTGIPVYIIGIGSDTDYSGISSLALRCNGDYYNADDSDLSDMLLEIYDEIYQVQSNLYKISYTSTAKENLNAYRTVKLASSEKGAFIGTTELEYMPKDSVAEINNSKLLSIIEQKTSSDDVAVAIVDLETDLEYRVGNARKVYVASGFYAPIYIVAAAQNQSAANGMMSEMDNDSGNQLIRSFGGLQSVNNALTQKGYTQTNFKRNFGDIAASNLGYENYTSAVDAAKIIRDIYNDSGYKKMSWDLSKDGISVPGGVSIYAHRGLGIGGAYNVFAVIESPEATYGLAIMTAHAGVSNEEAKAVAVPLISELMLEIHKEMVGN